jgi:hypothetical protein
MIVEGFSPHHHRRICYQLLSDPVGKTFAAYIGVLEAGERHMDFSPTFYRGGGQEIPDDRKEKISYHEAMNLFRNRVPEMERSGYTYRY